MSYQNVFSIISIPEPCSEDWHGMQENPEGVYCSKCTKNVVDFSEKTDLEVIRFLMEAKEKKEDVYGRFLHTQVHRFLKKSYHYMAISTIVSGIAIGSSNNVYSVVHDNKEKHEVQNDIDTTTTYKHTKVCFVFDEDGQPIDNAIIYCRAEKNGKQHIAKTNPRGFFGLLTNTEDVYEIIVEKKGYESQSVHIKISNIGSERIYLKYNDEGKENVYTSVLAGRVVDSNGAAVLGAHIRIPALSKTVLTDEYGRFIFSELRNKKYEVEVDIQGFQVQKYIQSAPATETVFVFNYRKETIDEILKTFGKCSINYDVSEENIGYVK